MKLKKITTLALGCIYSLSVFSMDNSMFNKRPHDNTSLPQEDSQKKHRSQDMLIIENNETINDSSEEVNEFSIEEAKSFAEAVRFIPQKNDQRKIILLSDFHGVITEERAPKSGVAIHWAEESEDAMEQLLNNPKIEMIISTAWNKGKDIIDNFNDLFINRDTFQVMRPSTVKKICIVQKILSAFSKKLDEKNPKQLEAKKILLEYIEIFKEKLKEISSLNKDEYKKQLELWIEEFLSKIDEKCIEKKLSLNVLEFYKKTIDKNLSQHKVHVLEDFKQKKQVKIAGETFSFNFFGKMVSVKNDKHSTDPFFRDKGISILSLTNPHLRPDYNGLTLGENHINGISSKEYSEIFFLDDCMGNIEKFRANIEWLREKNLLDKDIKVTPVWINPKTNKIHLSFSLRMKEYDPNKHFYKIKNEQGETKKEKVERDCFTFKDRISGRIIGKIGSPSEERYPITHKFTMNKDEKISIVAIYEKKDGTQEEIGCYRDVNYKEITPETSKSYSLLFFGNKKWKPKVRIGGQKRYTAETYYKALSDVWDNTPEWTHNEKVFTEAYDKFCGKDLECGYVNLNDKEDIDENMNVAGENLGDGKVQFIAYYCSQICKMDGFHTIDDPFFDGTQEVSRRKYAYALIAFLEHKGILPRQSCFRQIVLEYLGLDPIEFDDFGCPKDIEKKDK